MQISRMSRWNGSPAAALRIQRELAGRVVEENQPGVVRCLAGIDVGFEGKANQIARAAVVVLQLPGLEPVDYAIARLPVTFPYIPGLLAFREIPVILKALRQLKTEPDGLIVDGHGRAHPRRLGIASHLGVLLNAVTIGCAKSILCGKANEPKNQIGAWEPLNDRGEPIGAAVRTRLGTQPVYVSIGHRITLASAIDLVLQCCSGYRLPETTRWAHRLASGAEIDRGSIQSS